MNGGEFLKELLNLAGRVTQGLAGNPEAIQHGDEQVGHWRAVLVLDVPPTCNRPATATSQQER